MGEKRRLREALSGHGVAGLDSMIFVYHYEKDPRYSDLTRALFDEIEGGGLKGVTSTMTLMEVQVRPKRIGDMEKEEDYFYALTAFPNLSLRPLDVPTAVAAAGLRARYNLKAPDAIQVACCLAGGADVLLTNDADMKRVTEVDVLMLRDFL